MQKCSDPSGFLAKSMGAPDSDGDGCMAPASSNFSNYVFISNYYWGLCLCIDFFTSLAPSTSGISCTPPSF